MDFWVETPAEGNLSFPSLHILHHRLAPVPYPTLRFSSANSVHAQGEIAPAPMLQRSITQLRSRQTFPPYQSILYGGEQKEELHWWNLKSRPQRHPRPSPSSSPTSQNCPWGEVNEDNRMQAAGFRPGFNSSLQSLGHCALLSGFTAGLQLSLHPLLPACNALMSGFSSVEYFTNARLHETLSEPCWVYI